MEKDPFLEELRKECLGEIGALIMSLETASAALPEGRDLLSGLTRQCSEIKGHLRAVELTELATDFEILEPFLAEVESDPALTHDDLVAAQNRIETLLPAVRAAMESGFFDREGKALLEDLKKRKDSLQKQGEDSGEKRIPHILCSRRGIRLAIPALCVREVNAKVQINRFPLHKPGFSGMANLHGEALPVIDIDAILGIKKTEQELSSRYLLVAEVGKKVFALQLDDILELTELSPEKLHTEVVETVGRKVFTEGDQSFFILDLTEVIAA